MINWLIIIFSEWFVLTYYFHLFSFIFTFKEVKNHMMKIFASCQFCLLIIQVCCYNVSYLKFFLQHLFKRLNGPRSIQDNRCGEYIKHSNNYVYYWRKIEHGIRYGENQIDNAQDESSLSVKEFHFRLSKSSPATPNCWISHIL